MQYILRVINIPLTIGILLLLLTLVLHGWQTTREIDKSEETAMINERLTAYIDEAGAVLDRLEEGNTSLFEWGNKTDNPILKFEHGVLTEWSAARFVPEYRSLKGDYDVKFIRAVRNEFIAVKRSRAGVDFIVIIPVFYDSKIENQYFRSHFNTSVFPSQNVQVTDDSNYKIRYEGQFLFGIAFLPGYSNKPAFIDWVSVLTFYTGLFLLMIYVYGKAVVLSKKDFLQGFGFLSGVLFLIRYSIFELSFPTALSDDALFDSRIFASSGFNASLGDLFVNLMMMALVTRFLFFRFHKSRLFRSILQLQGYKKYTTGVFFLTVYIALFHFIFVFFQTIYHNSQISYDINTSIILDPVRIAALFVYLPAAHAVLFMIHIIFSLCRQLFPDNLKLTLTLLAVAGLFIGVSQLAGLSDTISPWVAAALFLALQYTIRSGLLGRFNFTSFLYLFIILISISLTGSLAVFHFENERETMRKKKFADQFLIENDYMAEYLLSVANEKIKNDAFIRNIMSSPFLAKDVIIAKIRKVYLSNYFDKYDVDFHIYNPGGELLESTADVPPRVLKLSDTSGYRTGYDGGIFLIDPQEAEATKHYINEIAITDNGKKTGSIVMNLSLKRIVPRNVYPEMLVDGRYLSPYENARYSYAVLRGKQVTYSSGDFNYGKDFIDNSPYQSQNTFSYDHYRHVAINNNAGDRVIVSSDDHSYAGIISNFSFLFLLKVFIMLAIIIGYSVFVWWRKDQPSYSTKIQLYLHAAFFLPLIAVSLTTLSLINASYEKKVTDEYHGKAENISSNLSSILSDFNEEHISKDDLTETIRDIAKFADADISIFDTKGQLLATNQPAIYDNNLLSGYMHAVACRRIVNGGENALIIKEAVGGLVYNSVYCIIRSFDTAETLGIVSIPFFDSEQAIRQSQLIVMTNIINVFAGVFIAFVVISFFTTGWLIFPLAFITQKLKRTSLTEFNEPLYWQADDEIGLMVGEYNKMLVKLEESKQALARSEKQNAWREIAQQVAHEIKNPLTPMKLTLQHFKRKNSGSRGDAETAKPIDSLLNQIDILDDIVSSFSTFAKMPIPERKKYELTTVIKRTAGLHNTEEGLNIDLQLPQRQVYTVGDEQLMGRILSNLILNAFQSDNKAEKQLEIMLVAKAGRLLLSIKDNGEGIPEEIRHKVFIPNFTTKETGSGIGLAIAKHGIEHAGGKIWFETDSGQGTTFFIELTGAET